MKMERVHMQKAKFVTTANIFVKLKKSGNSVFNTHKSAIQINL